MNEERKAEVKNTDMNEDMKQDAIDISNQALDRFFIFNEDEIADFIKKKFDRKYNPTWHCNVGDSFDF